MRRASPAVETTRGSPNSENGGSSGWIAEAHPDLLGHRHDLAEELRQVLSHLGVAEPVEAGDLSAIEARV